MSVAITPGNPGPISDPRLRAMHNWLGAVQKDLNQQSNDLMSNVPNKKLVGSPTPVSKELFKPKAHGAMQGRQYGHDPSVFGPLTRIG